MANDKTDYSKVHSLAEQRQAEFTRQTPREILLEMLGKLDRGELDPDCMVIAYGYWDKDDERCNGYAAGGMDMLAGYGAMYAALNMMANHR